MTDETKKIFVIVQLFILLLCFLLWLLIICQTERIDNQREYMLKLQDRIYYLETHHLESKP